MKRSTILERSFIILLLSCGPAAAQPLSSFVKLTIEGVQVSPTVVKPGVPVKVIVTVRADNVVTPTPQRYAHFVVWRANEEHDLSMKSVSGRGSLQTSLGGFSTLAPRKQAACQFRAPSQPGTYGYEASVYYETSERLSFAASEDFSIKVSDGVGPEPKPSMHPWFDAVLKEPAMADGDIAQLGIFGKWQQINNSIPMELTLSPGRNYTLKHHNGSIENGTFEVRMAPFGRPTDSQLAPVIIFNVDKLERTGEPRVWSIVAGSKHASRDNPVTQRWAAPDLGVLGSVSALRDFERQAEEAKPQAQDQARLPEPPAGKESQAQFLKALQERDAAVVRRVQPVHAEQASPAQFRHGQQPEQQERQVGAVLGLIDALSGAAQQADADRAAHQQAALEQAALEQAERERQARDLEIERQRMEQANAMATAAGQRLGDSSLQLKIYTSPEEAQADIRRAEMAKNNDRLTFRINKGYPGTVFVRFYSLERDKTWPDKGKAYAIKDDKIHDISIQGVPGERICYGAWVLDKRDEFWGAGQTQSKPRGVPADCIYSCDGGTTSTINLK